MPIRHFIALALLRRLFPQAIPAAQALVVVPLAALDSETPKSSVRAFLRGLPQALCIAPAHPRLRGQFAAPWPAARASSRNSINAPQYETRSDADIPRQGAQKREKSDFAPSASLRAPCAAQTAPEAAAPSPLALTPDEARMMAAATRSDGKTLLTLERAVDLLRGREERIVRGDCSVVWRGEAWFIPRTWRPGERVLCAPTRKGVYLRIQDPNRVRPDILAERVEPLHSPGRNAPGQNTETRWGTPTSPAPASADRDERRAGTRPAPPHATDRENTPRRTSGTAPSGRCAAANAMPPAPPIHGCICRCNLCSCRSLWP